MFKWLFGNSDPLHIPDNVQKRINEIERLNSQRRIARLKLDELKAEHDKYWNEANIKKPETHGNGLLNNELLKLVRELKYAIKQKEQKEKAQNKRKEDAKQAQRLKDAKKARLAREAAEAERSKNKPAKKTDSPEIRNKRKKLLQDAIDKHYSTLRRNFNRLLRVNDYGAVELDERREEFDKFLKSVGFTQHFGRLTKVQNADPFNLSRQAADGAYNALIKRIQLDVTKEMDAGFDPDTLPDDGHDFEYWVAENLKMFDWQATVSVGSGDQGVDVMASCDKGSVAIQCKLYSGSVGNKAVQEVMAGKTYYDADHAAVITNAKYTKSALTLAKANNIFLLSHRDIPNLKSIIFE